MTHEKNIYEELLKRKSKRLKQENSKYLKEISRPAKLTSYSFSKEIVIKVLNGGKFKGHGHTKRSLDNCLHYIHKGSEDLLIENNLGKTFTKENIKEVVETYTKDFKESPHHSKKKNRLFTHISISLPPNPENYSKFKKYNDEKLKNILKNTATVAINQKFPMNDFLYSLHDNGKSLHLHIILMCKGNDNKKVRINPQELQGLRSSVAKNLKSYDVKLNATSYLKKPRKKKLKAVHIKNQFKPGEVFQAKTPNWYKAEQEILNNKKSKSNIYYSLDLNKLVSKEDKEKFQTLSNIFNEAYKPNEAQKALMSFLAMHQENKGLAKWAIETRPQIFGILQNPNVDFSNIELDLKKINSQVLIMPKLPSLTKELNKEDSIKRQENIKNIEPKL